MSKSLIECFEDIQAGVGRTIDMINYLNLRDHTYWRVNIWFDNALLVVILPPWMENDAAVT